MRTKGSVAAGDPQTADAGAELLRAGGNTVDAVCAASFAAFVVESPLCSPAGAGALLLGTPAHGIRVLDFFAATPGLGAAPTDALDFFDVTVDFGATGQIFHVGRGAAAIPGVLPGLLAAHEAGGELPLSEVIAPAVALAKGGYRLSDGVAYIVSILEPIVLHSPAVAKIFGAQGGALPVGGATLHNLALADFLEAFAADPHGTLRGTFADALVDTCGPGAGGLITRRDLDAYRPVWREPLWTELGDVRLATNPPPSSGGALIALGMQLAQRIDLGRRAWLGPEHALEVATLLATLSEVRADGYDACITQPDAATTLFDPTRVRAREALHEQHRVERQLGSTTHISVLSERGDFASLTMSNGEGCGFALPELGIHVNNFLGEEDINPLGFHRSPPGRRMTTMMAPTALCRGSEPILVLGSGGSNRIRSAIVQALIARLAWRVDLAAAVQAPRLHVEGSSLWYEAPGWSEGAEDALRGAWPDATRFDGLNMFFGGVHAVTPSAAAGDPRRGGATSIV